MKRRLALGAALVAAALCVAHGAARADDLPSGRIGPIIGVRQGIGELGNQFGMGGILGVHAGWMRTSMERRWSFGVDWSVMWAFFGPDDPMVSDQSLRALETSLGPRARVRMGTAVPRFLVLSAGATLLRTNVPVPPDSERDYIGPYLGIGVEQYLRGRYLLTFEGRYGVLFNGPQAITLMISFSFGSY